jgi:hypothetical protein
MAKEVISRQPEAPAPLFNTALEAGVRAVIVLDAIHPHALDVAHLTWCDHLVVHTADFGGPESLHPDIPQRTGELLVRRRLVEDGVTLMRRLHMIVDDVGERGISYLASDDASAFVEMLRTDYSIELKKRAAWLATFLADKSEEALAALIAERIGRWAIEFQGESRSIGAAR